MSRKVKAQISTRPERRHWPRVLVASAGAGFLFYDMGHLHLLHHLLGAWSPPVLLVAIIITVIWVVKGKVVRDLDEEWAQERK